MVFYKSLMEAVKSELKEVTEETILLFNGYVPGSPISQLHSDFYDEEESNESGNEKWGIESRTSYAIAIDISTNRTEDLGDLIGLYSSLTSEVEAGNITTILETTRITEMAQIDRLLSQSSTIHVLASSAH